MIAHKPVLSHEVIEYLNPQSGQNFIDCTLGGGGHAEKILEKTSPDGKLLGIDLDNKAIELAAARLKQFSKRIILANNSYVNIKKIVKENNFSPIDGILFDLGLSSDQLQNSGRGFTFQSNEPLDMRFCVNDNDLTARLIVNEWPAREIEKILYDYADERFAKRIVKSICDYRKEREIGTTLQLVEIIIKSIPYHRAKIHPATKTFQALRIAVNDELNNVRKALSDCMDILEPKGKLAVITFHSAEDRIVKSIFKRESRGCLCPNEIPVCRCGHKPLIKLITKKPVKPSEREITENFRSRSAKLRVVERL